MLSYNQANNRRIMLRHIFWPSTYGMISEATIAVLALIVFNLSALSSQLLGKSGGVADPLSLWSQLIQQLLGQIQEQRIVQQVLLFGLWAVVGALVYILVFRTAQILLGVKHSVATGMLMVRQDHAYGALRWFASLHDFLAKLVIVLLGGAAVAMGAIVCFGIASQELNNGLAVSFPSNIVLILFSILAAVISVRVVVLGISLLSSRFRNWYTV